MDVRLTLDEALLAAIREEMRAALAAERDQPRLYNVASAAEYLDMSEEALRGLLKRGQIECLRSETGRITFTREQLDRHAAGDAA
jgi:Helix-turn-helix domain